MVHINPIEYPNLVKRSFDVIQISADRKRIEIDIAASNLRLYYGKLMMFFIDAAKYYGMYQVSFVNNVYKHYLVLDAALPAGVVTKLITYETFVVSGDNQAITLQDVQERCVATESKVTEFGETNIGNSGLINGLQTLKINQALYDFKKDVDLNITNSFTPVCDLKIPSINTLARYRLFLYDSVKTKGLFCCDIIISSNADYCRLLIDSHILQSNNQNEYDTLKNSIMLKLNKKLYSNGEGFVTVNIGLKLNNNISDIYSLRGYIGCKSSNDLITPSVTINSTTPVLLNGLEIIECDKTLISVDNYGEQRSARWKETIFQGARIRNTHLISNQTPGNYIIDTLLPNDVPGGSVDDSVFGSENTKFTIDWSKANLTIYPSKDIEGKSYEDLSSNNCLLITNSKRIFVGIINRTTKNVAWFELSTQNHVHHAKDIITNANYQFVNQIEKDSWNKGIGEIASTPWRPTVRSEADLPNNAMPGFSVTVTHSTTFPGLSVIYQFSQNAWKPVSVNIIPVMATTNAQVQYTNGGTLVNLDFISKVDTLGIGSLLVKGKEMYVSATNERSQYNTTLTDSYFFDMVKRAGTNITPAIYSINFGFHNGMGEDNSVTIGNSINNPYVYSVNIGTGLISKSNAITLGKYNSDIDDLILNIGNGTSNTERYSVLTLDRFSNLTLKGGNGFYYIEGIGPDMLLTSGGYTDSKEFVKRQEFINELEKKADANKFGFFKHETKDNSYLEPIVFISGLYKDYVKYDV